MNTRKIYVTKTFLPPIEEYQKYLDRIWRSGVLTNQGPLLHEFEESLGNYLDIDQLHFVANGTIAIQLALRALAITEGEIITTPFTYVATTSAILWERCKPVFVDIDPTTLNIDPSKIEAAITPETKAILAVHVFGNPCDVEAIEAIAKKYNLKVIYDAAHAFGVRYKDKTLLAHGDLSVCSFHATKLFQTIEGGCIITRDEKVSEKIELLKRFGHNGDEHFTLGINGKASEFQAAMGLCGIKYVDANISRRKALTELYDQLLSDIYQVQNISNNTDYNYSYYPVLFENEALLKQKMTDLEKNNVFPRRYFYPSLNKLPYITDGQTCPISEDISSRVLCLPLYTELEENDIRLICEVLNA